MFSRFIRQASRRAPRLMAKRAEKALASGAKLTKTALRQGTQALNQTGKVLRRTAKAAQAAEAERTRRPPPTGRFVTADGVRVHYIARGKGRPVVLIHGNGTMAEDFAICGLIDQLARRYRVIAIDRPGFGHTDRPRDRLWTAAAQADLVRRTLDHLKAERPVVVGHSWGTLVALALAVDGALPLRGLVLLSGYYYPTHRADVLLASPLAVPGLGDAARALVPAAARHAMAPHVFRHVFWPEPVPARFLQRFPLAITLDPLQQRASAEDTATLNAAAALLAPHYPRLPVPVAILAGNADAVVKAGDHSGRLHEQVPDGTLTILPGRGHMIHYSAKAQIGRAVDSLMDLRAAAGGKRGR